METLFDIKEPVTITVSNLVAAPYAIKARKVKILLGGKHAQYDKHIELDIDTGEPKWLKKYRSVCNRVYLDGMVRYTITYEEMEIFDTADYFPVYSSLATCRLHLKAQQHLGTEYFRGNITQDQYYTAFRQLTEA